MDYHTVNLTYIARKTFHYNLTLLTSNTYNIMTTSNSTQKLFTTGQLVGIIFIAAVVVTLVFAIATGDLSGFNSVGLGK